MVKFARRPSVATQQRLILARINGCHTVVATHRVSGEVSVYAGRLNEQRDKSVWAWCVISAACARVYPEKNDNGVEPRSRIRTTCSS